METTSLSWPVVEFLTPSSRRKVKVSPILLYVKAPLGMSAGFRMSTLSHDNEADLLTKLLPSGEKRKGFVAKIVLHHILTSSEPNPWENDCGMYYEADWE